METAERQPAPGWARAMDAFNTLFTQDLLGGPRMIKMAWVINLHKALVVPVVAGLMVAYGNFSTAACVYLALHGSYGVVWLLKHVAFRDTRWETRTTLAGALFTFVLLATYFVAPFLLISDVLGQGRPAPPDWLLAACVGLFVLGVAVMVTSDCQKNTTLTLRPGLISNGMFRHVRHPNYLGEMMLYAGLAMLVRHWIPWLVLAYWWSCVFLVNSLMIESSLSRYPEWAAYQARTGMFLPWRAFSKARGVSWPGSRGEGD